MYVLEWPLKSLKMATDFGMRSAYGGTNNGEGEQGRNQCHNCAVTYTKYDTTFLWNSRRNFRNFDQYCYD